ncbi:BCS1-like ATPase-like protein [Westerdykella ornata]|uniref:BCS1-like ATPase-like protein n=1 Tax=Westerdykella ornata TaxID=318751 RepID=A0A6A6J888_WESOR|nr:BCS1-like ATPase-like protein [Westerdykella ornata]KAF2272632.1 BCS1-like ATPase-like protein [Westerdykella ornata]
MDFTKLDNIKFDSSSNSTLTSLPSLLLEAFIPGYGLISQIIFRLFGFDIGLAVSGCIIVYGLGLGGRIIYYKALSIFVAYFMCCIEVEDDDDLFEQIMEWMSEQRMTKKSRSLRAVSHWMSQWHETDEERKAADEDVLDESGIFNFEKWASTIPPRYEPSFGSNVFWFEGRMFFFSRTRREKSKSIWGGEDQFLDISCIGRSTEPIKELLDHIKKWRLKKNSKMTAVNRPAPKEERMGSYSWDRQSLRPSRPLSTVSLDQEQKAMIVRDINEYLHPSSALWYARRGIPYRRGYLFWGSPGTGKTSLSFALAGIFGLDIYCVSLTEPGLTEACLNKLFADLPRRCIVLLEDIDAAGLRREDEPTDSKDNGDAKDDTSDDGTLTKITKADLLPGSKPGPPALAPTADKSRITLSGLLNVIDGVASHEGRVLIMTTNCPSKLDPALVRPGRVDLQIKFTLATSDQIRDIFIRMYSTERDAKAPHSRSGSKSSSNPDAEFLEMLSQAPILNIVEPEKLKFMAEEFADALPAGVFSPAEIQGFLLMRKKDPRRALEEVAAWRDGLLEKKGKMMGEGKVRVGAGAGAGL